MRLYMWDDLDGITDNWHDGGALVIATDGDPLDAWMAEREKVSTPTYLRDELPDPSRVLELAGDVDPFVRVYPDAGCC